MVPRCPACSTPIILTAHELTPRKRTVYRCPTCRLELVYDADKQLMEVNPLQPSAADGETDEPSSNERH